MNIKSLVTTFSMASLLLVGYSQTASADWKGYSGANCMQSSEIYNDFRRTYYGYINDSANAAMVICPIVRDVSQGGTARIDKVHVTLTSHSNSYCWLYSLTHDGDFYASQFKNFPAGDPVEIVFSDVDASNAGSYTISCRIPGLSGINRSYIRTYAVNEVD